MQNLVSFLLELMTFRTLAQNPEAIRHCTAHIQRNLTAHGVPHEILSVQQCPSILVCPQPRRAPILLISHMDVVDGPDHLFSPRVQDGRIWGRGAVDDKYAIALSLALFYRNLSRLRERGHGVEAMNFGLLITSDEESGGEKGTGTILPLLNCHFAIVLDGGSPEQIITCQKGILHLRITAKGKSAHAARPWLGRNAIENLMEDLSRLQGFFSGKKQELWEKTLNISRIEGGSAINQVPDSASAFLDIRFTEKDDPAEILQMIQKSLKHSSLSEQTHDPVFTAGSSPYLDLLKQAAPWAGEAREHGASDAHFLSARGIPGVVWGADGEMSQHSDSERVRIDSIEALDSGLQSFLDLCTVHKETLPWH
ncbi:M20/M25/M40 family metallo-hydrolase [Desulfobotulus sp. H1]|uniref:M20/M25/M40 family metallo-hydrolase n=1 Tax=Desulfobotulus pelophilus TaxID=2823377 RepID=A0ABT3NB36_9BACT|nr:M20/M25/M40 family metallo-hydrolase [Desulfobotulus pelophilus]MCW7754675.1 M20/M25/M40 family metallo-hydrolase [Desulfobotulus pelophilus]